MRRAAALAVLLFGCGCASVPRPGPELDGIAVSVPSRDEGAAARQAVESLLPLFLTSAARLEKSAAIEKAVFASPKRIRSFIGDLRPSSKGGSLALVDVNMLSAALQDAGLIRPPGYASGPEALLLALGDRAARPTSAERSAAGALQAALFARGVRAQDVDADAVKPLRPVTARTEAGAAAQAAAGGWAWFVTGRAADSVGREAAADSWVARTRLSLSLYGVAGATAPARFDADGEAVDASSSSAVARAFASAAGDAAARMEALLASRRGGRSTVGILISGDKDLAFLIRLISDLRRAEGVDGAALITWQGRGMALIHAYIGSLTADGLAEKLVGADGGLRVSSDGSEDVRLTTVGPDVPSFEKTGGER